jgi:hypothetical protein
MIVFQRLILTLLAAAAIAAAAPAPATAQELPWLKALRGQNARFADEHGRQVLFRGVNVSQLADYWSLEGRPSNAPLTASDFAQMREMGFNHVRLLMSWSRLEPRRGQLDQAYLDEIAQAVAWAKAEGLYVVLDMHQDAWGKHVAGRPGEACPWGTEPMRGWDGAPEWATLTDGLSRCALFGIRELSPAVMHAWQSFWLDRDGIQARLVQTWKAVAARFAAEPAVAGYDLLNEPNPGYLAVGAEAATIGRFYQRAVDAIRAVDARHTIFVEPTVVRSAASPVAVMPPMPLDDNLAYAPHIYFDQAGAEASDWEHWLAWKEGLTAGGLPIWIGEFPLLDREGGEGYNRTFPERAEAALVGWSHWVWKETCGNPHHGYGGVPPSSMHVYDCDAQAFTGLKQARVPHLVRAYPLYAPGRLTALTFSAQTKRMTATGTDAPAGGAPLRVFVPRTVHYGGADPAVSTTGLRDVRIEPRADGNAELVGVPTGGSWSVELAPR